MRLIILVLFLAWPSLSWAMGNVPMDESPLIGKAAPDAVLARTQGGPASVLGLRQTDKTILIFWATWCPHCQEELGAVNDSIAPARNKGIRIILVDVQEDKKDVQHYLDHRQMKLVSFVDGDGVLQEAYRLIGIPTLVFIDGKGIVRNVIHEFPSNYQDYFRSQ